MSYDTFMIIFYVALGLSVALLSVSAVLFFKLNIISVIGDLSGSTARKAIEDIREHNTASGGKAHKPSPVNRSRGKITDKMTKSGRLEPQHPDVNVTPGTARFRTSELNDATTVLASSEGTTLLATDNNSTTVLETSYAQPVRNETSVLSVSSTGNETTVLGVDNDSFRMAPNPEQFTQADLPDGFVIEEEITFIHTSERIG